MAEVDGDFWTARAGVVHRGLVPDPVANTLYQYPMQAQSGEGTTAYIDDSGLFYIEGSNAKGWLGAGQADSLGVFVKPFGATPVSEVAMGNDNLTVRIGGDVWTAGEYSGNGSPNTNGYELIHSGTVTKLAFNPTNAVGWINAGQAFVMGEHQFSRFTSTDLGTSSQEVQVPYLIPGMSDVKEIILTARYILGIIEGAERRLYVCGKNDGGLGVNGGASVTTLTDTGLVGVLKVYLSEGWSVALLDDGRVMTCGSANFNGMSGATTAFTDLGLTNVTDIFRSASTFYAMREDGVIFSWGNNTWDCLFQSGVTANGQFVMGQTFLPTEGVKFLCSDAAVLEDGRVVFPSTNGFAGDATEFPGLKSSTHITNVHNAFRALSSTIVLSAAGELADRGSNPYMALIEAYTTSPAPTLNFASDYAAI